MNKLGRVFLVGAGPGDPDLLTVKAARVISQADVVVHDRLVSDQILALVPAKCRLVSVGKTPGCHPVPQEEINRILAREAAEGRRVVRLKGGDPFIFGRGSEELQSLRAAGLNVTVVPGITAAQGCAVSAGVPLTHRGLATSVHYVTGHRCKNAPLDLDWQGLADHNTTIVIYMGLANISEIAGNLVAAGRASDTPVLAINNGTAPNEKRLVSNLSDIVREVERAEFSGPVLFIVGRVVEFYTDPDSRNTISAIVEEALA